MQKLFGVDMTTLTVILVLILTICLFGVAWIAWRRRVVFNLGARNLPRRKAQTLLIVIGLMLSTLIITSALGVGDTVDRSTTSEVYRSLGAVDIAVVEQDRAESTFSVLDGSIPAKTLNAVQTALVDSSEVDGIAPILAVPVSVINETTGQTESRVAAIGLDPGTLSVFGGITTVDGEKLDLATLPQGAVALNQTLADLLMADEGSVIDLYVNNQPVKASVSAVVLDSFLTGSDVFSETGSGRVGGLVLPLASLQALTGNTDTLSAIAVSSSGDERSGIGSTSSVARRLDSALAGSDAAVNTLKQNLIDEATLTGQVFAGLFLVVGLFSIAAGVLLILLIFTMLAAERRSEMGMARAIGAQRKQLVQQFVSEGAAYSLLAGLLGAALGVASAIGIGYGLNRVFGDFINVEPYVSVRSVVAAYALGVVITFLAVAGSSWRISRLNIVAAIRDLPDTPTRRRTWRAVIRPVVLLLLGGLLTSSGIASGSAFPFMTGISLLIVGGALFLGVTGIPGRFVFSLAGVLLLIFWLLPERTFRRVFGEYDGSFEMFFVSGIFLVIASMLVLMQNDRWIQNGVNRVGRLFGPRRSAFSLAVAYPGSARSRTGMTAAMFSLIVFSLVTIATINLNFSNAFLGETSTAGWDVRGTSLSATQPDDLPAELLRHGVDPDRFLAIGVVNNPTLDTVAGRAVGSTKWARTTIGGMDESFVRGTEWAFSNRAFGYEDDQEIIDALLNEANVAVIPTSFIEGEDGIGGEGDALWIDIDLEQEAFAPATVELLGNDGRSHTLTVIGVISPTLSSLDSILVSDATFSEIYGAGQAMTYYFRLADNGASEVAAREIESALLPYGVQTVSIRDLLKENQRDNNGFFLILQAFMGLGMLVGIAAIGVIASRNVVERRQQIGVLRALGFQRGHVTLTFLVEAAYVVLLGVVSGTTLGLALARNLITSGELARVGDINFTVPWNTIAVVLLLAIGAALLAAWLPARQASLIAPAEALRYE